MKHYPADRYHPPIEGVSHSRAPVTYRRTRLILVAAIIYSAGLFTGALLFGEALLTLHTP